MNMYRKIVPEGTADSGCLLVFKLVITRLWLLIGAPS